MSPVETPGGWTSAVMDTMPAVDEWTRRRIDSFRHGQWPSIQQELANQGLHVVEPEWADAGEAYYWQHQLVSQYGKTEDHGWARVKAPASSASLIAHYLKKGMLLRDPSDGPSVEEPNAPASAESLGGPEYICERHRGRRIVFRNWGGYVHHCTHFQEPTQYSPEDVARRRADAAYYCNVHDVAMPSLRLAKRHAAVYVNRGQRHPTVEAMEVHHGDGSTGSDHAEVGAGLGLPDYPATSVLLLGDRDATGGTPKSGVGERGRRPRPAKPRSRKR